MTAQEFLEQTIRAMVNHPESVKVTRQNGQGKNVFFAIQVDLDDKGWVIGKEGVVIRSLQEIAFRIGKRADEYVSCDLVDPQLGISLDEAENLITTMARSLVLHQEDVRVRRQVEGKKVDFVICVNPDDIGRVVGKDGKMIEMFIIMAKRAISKSQSGLWVTVRIVRDGHEQESAAPVSAEDHPPSSVAVEPSPSMVPPVSANKRKGGKKAVAKGDGAVSVADHLASQGLTKGGGAMANALARAGIVSDQQGEGEGK